MLNFQLHSELLEKRTKKFIHDYDKFAAPLLYILMFIVVNDIAKFLFVCVILLWLFDFLPYPREWKVYL